MAGGRRQEAGGRRQEAYFRSRDVSVLTVGELVFSSDPRITVRQQSRSVRLRGAGLTADRPQVLSSKTTPDLTSDMRAVTSWGVTSRSCSMAANKMWGPCIFF